MNNLSLTTIVLVHEPRAVLAECLRALKWSPQLVVIDQQSGIEWPEFLAAEKIDAQNIRIKQAIISVVDFGEMRNTAMNHANTEWVLFIDSDEVMPKVLSQEVLSILKRPQANGYFLRRSDIFHDQPLQFGEAHALPILRLGRKGSGRWVGKVHEVWEIDGPTATLQHELLHHAHPSLTQFIDAVNGYTSQLAAEKTESGVILNSLAFPIAKFVQNYVWKRGFLDGYRGLIYAVAMSLHSATVRIKRFEHEHGRAE